MSSTLKEISNCLGLKWGRPWISYHGEDLGKSEHGAGVQSSILGR